MAASQPGIQAAGIRKDENQRQPSRVGAGTPEKKNANYPGTAPSDTAENRLRRENRELKEALGEKAAQIDFFAAALRRVKADRLKTGGNGDPACTPKSGHTPPRKAN